MSRPQKVLTAKRPDREIFDRQILDRQIPDRTPVSNGRCQSDASLAAELGPTPVLLPFYVMARHWQKQQCII